MAMPYVISCVQNDNSLHIQMENPRKGLLEVLRTLRNCDAVIEEITTNEPTLEDIFVDTIKGGGKEKCF